MALRTIEDCDPGDIRHAIWMARTTKDVRTDAGYVAFDMLLLAPGHTCPYRDLEERFATPGLHLGWFCHRAAELLHVSDPSDHALLDRTQSDTGEELLTVKPCVVAALTT